MPEVFTAWTVLPHRPIEKVADNLWRVSGKLGQVQRQMVLARMRDGRIVVDNALALDAAEMAEVEAWGEPAVLIVPNAFHRQDAAIWKQRYPKSIVVAPPRGQQRIAKVVPVDATADAVPHDDTVQTPPRVSEFRPGPCLFRANPCRRARGASRRHLSWIRPFAPTDHLGSSCHSEGLSYIRRIKPWRSGWRQRDGRQHDCGTRETRAGRDKVPDAWGKRPGSGRKPRGSRAGARHQTRPEHDPRHPVHVTTRVVGSAAGLRRKDTYLALREATIVPAKREAFRIVHMSIQRDHIHLIVEADSTAALSKGVRDSRSPLRGRSTRRSPRAAATVPGPLSATREAHASTAVIGGTPGSQPEHCRASPAISWSGGKLEASWCECSRSRFACRPAAWLTG